MNQLFYNFTGKNDSWHTAQQCGKVPRVVWNQQPPVVGSGVMYRGQSGVPHLAGQESARKFRAHFWHWPCHWASLYSLPWNIVLWFKAIKGLYKITDFILIVKVVLKNKKITAQSICRPVNLEVWGTSSCSYKNSMTRETYLLLKLYWHNCCKYLFPQGFCFGVGSGSRVSTHFDSFTGQNLQLVSNGPSHYMNCL